MKRRSERNDVVEDQCLVQLGSFKPVEVLNVDVGELLTEVYLERKFHSLSSKRQADC